jgi:NAD(P)-dependent dehydrogenase (short-subunit alcohol dehydrogenase family)
MPCAALDRSVTVTSTSAARTAFQSSATLSGSSDQELRSITCATQQRNRYFLHEKYATPELGSRRIAVNTVAPGPTATDFSGGVVRDNPDLNKRLAGMTPLGRVGLPDDIGAMIASLISEDNRWVNAQRIEVSGGLA